MSVTRKRGRPPGSTKKGKHSSVQQQQTSVEDTSNDEIVPDGTPKINKRSSKLSLGSNGGTPGAGGTSTPNTTILTVPSSSRSNRTVGGPNNITAVPLDTSGNPPRIENDEYVLPEDPAGENKVTKKGELLEGRDYRVRTFTVLGRGDRMYMLSTEPARCMGFRDSYLLFQKHRRLHKIIVSDEEKFDLIEREIIPHSYKGRPIGIVTARSVFREFGARIVIGGKRVYDDYYEKEAKSVGFIPGQVADPDDRLPPDGTPYNKNQYVAWHGASSVYHQYNALPPMTTRDSMLRDPSSITTSIRPKKKAPVITDENWMYEHARASADYNSELTKRRRLTRNGVREGHTGSLFFPQSTQPRKVRWQKAEESEARSGDKNQQTDGSAGQVVVETILNMPNPLVNTGLKDVPPEIYEHVSSDIKQAIENQCNYERQWQRI